MKNEILRVKLRCIHRLRIFKKITLCNRKQNLILHPGGEPPAPHLPASLRLAVQSTAASGLTVICGTGDSCKIRARPRPAARKKNAPTGRRHTTETCPSPTRCGCKNAPTGQRRVAGACPRPSDGHKNAPTGQRRVAGACQPPDAMPPQKTEKRPEGGATPLPPPQDISNCPNQTPCEKVSVPCWEHRWLLSDFFFRPGSVPVVVS